MNIMIEGQPLERILAQACRRATKCILGSVHKCPSEFDGMFCSEVKKLEQGWALVIERALKSQNEKEEPGMEVVNLTPHEVCFYQAKDTVSKDHQLYVLPNTKPYLTLPPADKPARAAQIEEMLPRLKAGDEEIPLVRVQYGTPVDLPEPRKGVGLIVSALTVAAAREAGRTTDDLYLVARVVRDISGKVVGACALAKPD